LARLEEAKRYIDLNLTNPGLAPEKAASALKMSVRQLHLLFEPSGMTFGQYVSSAAGSRNAAQRSGTRRATGP
jgi:AraC-like DNA-binding protein